jgi:A/G-specific adenine glycosylase
MNVEPQSIARALIDWHGRAGRHDLPWQHDRSPYRVWISEIMLQQTQVATVVPYYERFVQRFPTVRALADAPLDDVLHLWSGLGYYARARNLHRAAVRVRDEFAGELPCEFETLMSLPGIGRSTAGAILALSRGARFPILDGNARRVLARLFAVEGDPGDRRVLDELWSLAERCTPGASIAVYTQAIMDLGASICVPRQPRCENCPLAFTCSARRCGREEELPSPRRVRTRRQRRAFMLAARREDGSVYLERRPDRGIWGGLWCLPQFSTHADALAWCGTRFAAPRCEPERLAAVQHSFTHFDLQITPLLLRCSGVAGVMEAPEGLWYKPREAARIGLPAPIRTLLDALALKE